jgi:hypothetical protein
MSGVLHEADIVDAYVASLCDELELRRIRYRVMSTRTLPGIAPDLRHEDLAANDLVLSCRVGWETRAQMRPNWSQVIFGTGASNKLARIVTDALGTWGRCYVYGHESRNPVRDPQCQLLNVPGTRGLEVVPFAINADGAHEYARRLRALGRDLAWAIHEYIGEEACTGKAAGHLQAPPKTADKMHTEVSTGLPSWVLDPDAMPLGLESPLAAKASRSQPQDLNARSNSGQRKQKNKE